MARTALARRSPSPYTRWLAPIAACAALTVLLLFLLLSLAGAAGMGPDGRGHLLAPQRWNTTNGTTAAGHGRVRIELPA